MLFTINGFDQAINLFFFLKKQLSIVLIRHRQSIYWLKEANSSFKVLPFFFLQLTCLPYSASQSFIKLILDHCLHLCDAYHIFFLMLCLESIQARLDKQVDGSVSLRLQILVSELLVNK